MSLHIAVDVGGTQLRAALFPDDDLTPLRILRTPTQGETGTPLERLIDLIAAIWPCNELVEAIGLAAPGPLDPYLGVIMSAPNIPGWEELPLRTILEPRFGVPVALGNDANLAALGEWKFGAGKGHHHLIYLTISTGIGGGVIINDQLLLGQHGLAAELGHTTVIVDGPVCGCGQRGHLEAVASGTGIRRWVEEELARGIPSSLADFRPVTGKQISAAADKGDALAVTALARAGRYVGIALASFLHIFNPSVIVIGGGVSRSGHFLFDPMRQAMQEHVLAPQYLENLEIKPAAFGDEAGLMGALALARSYLSEPATVTVSDQKPE